MRLALVFPGQGSQFAGMGRELAEWSAGARAAFQEADDALGFSLSDLCFEGPEELLRLTENTQPAILAASIAALRALKERMDLPAGWVAGHSLGEYTALVAAGSLAFADAVRAVRERGRAMQEAVPPGMGAMAALLGMDAPAVEELCRRAGAEGGLVSPANYNSPGQVVIAGRRDTVERAVALYREMGGKRAVELPVSAPFHCALMEPAARRMEQVLGDIAIDRPKIVLINNAEAEAITEAPEVLPSLVRQVTSPVRWDESVRRMTGDGATAFIEVGPGKVLAGLVRRIAPQVKVQSFGAPSDLEAVAAMVKEVS